MELTIKNVKVTNQDSYIFFTSTQYIKPGTYLAVKNTLESSYDLEYTFEVDEVDTNSPRINGCNTLSIRAVQNGYGSNIYKGKTDIRRFIGAEISVVTDEEKIKKIRRQSSYL